VNATEYEVLIKRVRNSKDAAHFYREVLRPLLEQSVTVSLSADEEISDRKLLEIRAFAKVIKDMEILINRVMLLGDAAQKVLEKAKEES
jgi:hypothetical protein